MASTTTDTDKQSVAAFEVKDAIDARDVDNCVNKEHNVHRLHLLLFVVLAELFVEEITEGVEVLNLLIDLALFILGEEVDKDSITMFPCHAVLRVIHLELGLELVVHHLLEGVTIFEADQSVVEDTQDFVAPQFDDLLLALVVDPVGEEESLVDLGDVTHVVDVMGLLRGR